MPIPNSSMGACLRFLRREKPDMARDQRIAICMETMRKAGHGEPKPEEKK